VNDHAQEGEDIGQGPAIEPNVYTSHVVLQFKKLVSNMGKEGNVRDEPEENLQRGL